jgi:Flp pilus assembly pilin Flp
MLRLAQRKGHEVASVIRRFNEDEEGAEAFQIVMVLALAAIVLFGIGELTGISGGADTNGGLFGVIKDKLGGLLGF